ncbi:Nucleosomal histone H3-Lys79 methylase [Rhizophlyctis rosea]|uniref:Histone-lysine N-methyltransferase, H3 lysine-79 specific n=1 Tax=Rhizophlyctis rosea TaxID=64517 RepID=A0AAD5SIT9_9FUNG|nr:Nucleosomal histone H3-Lys79 methylase [Rhizophlyctis rosea]
MPFSPMDVDTTVPDLEVSPKGSLSSGTMDEDEDSWARTNDSEEDVRPISKTIKPPSLLEKKKKRKRSRSPHGLDFDTDIITKPKKRSDNAERTVPEKKPREADGRSKVTKESKELKQAKEIQETNRKITKHASNGDLRPDSSKSGSTSTLSEKAKGKRPEAVTKPRKSTDDSRRISAVVPRDHRHRSKKSYSPCIHAVDVVRSCLRIYQQCEWHAAVATDEEVTSPSFEGIPPTFPPATEDIATVELEYPGELAIETFPLLFTKKSNEYNPMYDISQTVKALAKHCIPPTDLPPFGNEKSGIIRSVIKACKLGNGEDLKVALSQFNECMRNLKEDGGFESTESHGGPAEPAMVSHVLEQAYARAVAAEAHLLNQYEGFSNNVYGEVRHRLVSDIIREANIQPHHTFLDMGSGIGNVVLQVAAQCLCDCYGIEVMETPARLGKMQEREFLSRMRYYAKPCGRITLRKGDFLEDQEFHGILCSADVIFVNNYAFSAELNQMILAKFLDLKEGAKVISLKSFVPGASTGRLASRRSNAIESIFKVKEMMFAQDSVSWMNEGGSYFIHTVDRRQLQKR